MAVDNLKQILRNIIVQEVSSKRELTGITRRCAFIIGVTLTVLVFYTAFRGVFVPLIQNSIVLCFLLALTFLWYPATAKSPKNKPSVTDYILVVASLLVLFWTIYNQPRFEMRMPFVSEIQTIDKIVGLTLIILVLECCRRTVGIMVTSIGIVFILYGFLGSHMPGILQHPGFSFEKFIDILYLTTEGIFSSLVGMTATIIFGFISFGVFLQSTGGDKYFIDIALALAGKKSGGPAKVAVLGSSLMAMISGSSIANIVTTGSLTIPMMKSIGYKPEQAGAVEAVASSGGQIMPPIMGAGAFLMADALGVSFFDIAMVSFAPAVLFYCALWFFNDKIAKKRGLAGMSEVPELWSSIKNSFHMWIPIFVLIVMCIMKFTPFLAAAICTVLIYLMSYIKKTNKVSFKELFYIIEKCAISMTTIAGIIATASVIVAIINVTGLMIKSTSIILSLSGGNIVITILILLVISYIMGMGLPVTSCYIILAALGVPSLVKCGATPIGAHLMLFWSSMVAGITPPVCVAAYVAANVAGSDPMKTGLNSLKMGSMFYLLPLLFLFTNILTGSIYEIIALFAIALASIYFFVVGLEGYFLTKIKTFDRILSILIFFLLFMSTFNIVPISTKIVFIITAIIVSVIVYIRQQKSIKISQAF